MDLLTRDQEVFDRRYSEASVFVSQAEDRAELYEKAMRGFDNWPYFADLSRMKELLGKPWCREPWFVIMLRGDAPCIEPVLQEFGL